MPVLLFLLWVVLNGRITVEIVAIGMIVIALVYLFMIRVFHWTLKRDLLLLRSLPIFVLYLMNLLREAAVAAAGRRLTSAWPRSDYWKESMPSEVRDRRAAAPQVRGGAQGAAEPLAPHGRSERRLQGYLQLRERRDD